MDGSWVERLKDQVSCVGVARDANGTFIVGFSNRLGSCKALDAEFWAIINGLELVWKVKASRVVIETDLLLAYNL